MDDKLSREEINILMYIDKNVYLDRSESFRLFSSTSDYSIDQLLNHGYIRLIPPKSSDELDLFLLTPKGKTYISEYASKSLEKEIEIKRIRNDTFFSKTISVLALIISIVAVIVQIILS